MSAIKNDYDVLVAGLGIMGASVLYHLSGQGLNVCGIDRFKPPHSLGSSHGESRIIRQAYFETPLYVPLAKKAYDIWKDIERQSGKTLFIENGSLMIGKAGSAIINGTMRSATQHHLPVALLNHQDLNKRFPALQVNEDTVAVLEKAAGVLLAEPCVETLLSLAESKGAKALFNESIINVENRPDQVIVTTNKQQYTSDRLIISVGAWLNQLLPGLALPLKVERRVVHWFTNTDMRCNDFLSPTNLPVYIWEYEQDHMIYGFPDLGNGIKIANTKQGVFSEPDILDRTIKQSEIDEMHDIVTKRFNIKAQHLRSLVCMYTMTPDEHFIIDYYPHSDRIIVASACSGHGFKFASAIGKILAEMATGQTLSTDIGAFSIQRFIK